MQYITLDSLNQIKEKDQNDTMTCYSGYFLDKTREELNEWISKEFTRSREIKNTKTKKQVQQILEQLDEFFKTLKKDNENFCFILDSTNAYFYKLSNKLIDIIKKYITKDTKLIIDYSFHLKYWKDLYFNDSFYNVFCLDKKDKFLHYSFTDTKYRQNDSFSSEIFNEVNLKSPVDFFIMTKDNKKNKIMEKLSNLATFVELEGGNNQHDKLKNTLNLVHYDKHVQILNDRLGELDKNPDMFIFGNDIIKAIKNYQVKEVYCYDAFRDKIEKNIEKECLNFKWYIFKKTKDDTRLGKLDSYKGIFAKKYFV